MFIPFYVYAPQKKRTYILPILKHNTYKHVIITQKKDLFQKVREA